MNEPKTAGEPLSPVYGALNRMVQLEAKSSELLAALEERLDAVLFPATAMNQESRAEYPEEPLPRSPLEEDLEARIAAADETVYRIESILNRLRL